MGTIENAIETHKNGVYLVVNIEKRAGKLKVNFIDQPVLIPIKFLQLNF
jgi:hypothetical protein